MSDLSLYETLFIVFAFVLQIILIVYFGLRKWAFDTALKYGWIVYSLGFISVIISILLIVGGMSWQYWLGGFILAAWAILGWMVDIAVPVEWRNPINWPIFVPYVLLYLASMMFYWWPLANFGRSYWFAYALLFVISTVLNITSHGPAEE